MSAYSDATWIAVLFSAGFILAGTVARKPLHCAAAGAVFTAVICFAPAGGGTLIGHLKGLQYEPSIGSVLIFTALVCARVSSMPPGLTPERRPAAIRNAAAGLNGLLAATLLAGCALYPMALGLGPFDPYALGYDSRSIAVAAVGSWMLIWFNRMELAAWWILLAALAALMELGESGNLFDYLLDPIALAAALAWAAGKFCRLIPLWLRKAAPR